MAAEQPALDAVQLTYGNPETGGHAEYMLGFSALMLRPGQTLRLPMRSPATVFRPPLAARCACLGGRSLERPGCLVIEMARRVGDNLRLTGGPAAGPVSS